MESLDARTSRIYYRLRRARDLERGAWNAEGYPSRGWTWEASTRATIRADRLSRLHTSLMARIDAREDAAILKATGGAK